MIYLNFGKVMKTFDKFKIFWNFIKFFEKI